MPHIILVGTRTPSGRFTRVVESVLARLGWLFGRVPHGALMAFVVILALEQLEIDVGLLSAAFQLAFGGLCLGLALAFGLGGRAWAESILERTRHKR